MEGINPRFDSDGALSVKAFGAKGDGTTDDSAAIAAAVAACPAGGKLIFPPATYVGVLAITKSMHVDLQGSTLKPPSTASASIINVTGTASGTTFVLAAPAARGDRSVTCTASVTGVVAGDLVVLRDDTVRVGDSAPDVNLEVHEVLSVAGAVVTFKDTVRIAKAVAASSNLYKLTPIENVVVENVVLEALTGTAANNGVHVEIARGVIVRNVRMTKSVGPCVTFRRAYNVLVDGFHFSAPQLTGSGQGYGIALAFGTGHAVARNGYGSDMRHVCDAGGSYDVLFEDVIAVKNASAPYVLSHNGWDADVTCRRCNAYGGTSYAFLASSQGVADAFTLQGHGFVVEDSEAYIDTSGFNVGIYWQFPVRDFRIENVKLVYGDGSAFGAGNYHAMGIRMLSANNHGLVKNVRIVGYPFGVYKYNVSQVVPANSTDRVVFEDVSIENATVGMSFTFTPDIIVERARILSPAEYALQWSYGATVKLRELVLRDIRISGFVAGRLIQHDGNDPVGANGVHGVIENITTDLTTDDNLAIVADQALTIENILITNPGGFVRMAAAGPVTMAADPFPIGFVEGQRLTLLSVGSDITIPDGTNNVNNGGGNIVLGAAKRGAQFVWSGLTWVQAS